MTKKWPYGGETNWRLTKKHGKAENLSNLSYI